MKYDDTSIPDTYAKSRALSDDALRWWVETVSRRIDRTPRRILDVGCGTGRFTPALQTHFDSLAVGVDSSRRMISQAPRGDSILFAVGDAVDLPVKASSVDLIFLSMVYHHIVDKEQALAEFHRVLAPNGSLCIRNSTRDLIGRLPYLKYFPAARAINERKLPAVLDVITCCSEQMDFKEHSTFDHVFASTPEEYEHKIAARSLSDLTSIDDEEFEIGLTDLRKNLESTKMPVVVPVDLFICSKSSTTGA